MSDNIEVRDRTAGIEKHWHGKNEIHEKIEYRDKKSNPLVRFDNLARPLFLQPTEDVEISRHDTEKDAKKAIGKNRMRFYLTRETSIDKTTGSPVTETTVPENIETKKTFVVMETRAIRTDGETPDESSKKSELVSSGFSILVSTDDGLPVGVPFNPVTYQYNTNAKFVEFVESSLKDVPHVIHSAGTLCNRGRLFISVSLTDAPKYRIDGRAFEDYLSFLDSVDKSCVLAVVNSSVCTVCNNTFNLNLQSEGYLDARNKHTRSFHDRQKEIAQIIQGALTARENLYAKLKEFKQFPVSLDEAESVFAAFIADGADDIGTRSRNMIRRLTELFRNGKGNKGVDLLDAFSAVTDYYTHESSAPKALSPDADETPEDSLLMRQVESSEIGDGAKAKRAFYKALCGFIENRDKFSGCVKIGNDLLVAYEKNK